MAKNPLSALALILLFLSASARAESILPKGLCGELKSPAAEDLALAQGAAPELAQGGLKEIPAQLVLTIVGWAQGKGMSGLDLFTDEGFRSDCAYFLSRKTLRAVDARYDLDLSSRISGEDLEGRHFEMAGIIVGKSRLVAVYDGEVRYHNERYDRDFKMARVVAFDAPESGTLNNIEGLWAKAGILGHLQMHEFKRNGPHTLKVNVGGFIKENELLPIAVRGAAPLGEAPATTEAVMPQSIEGGALETLQGLAR